jgi:hypothetical protein
MGAGNRCEGYKKPTNWQIPKAPAMAISAGRRPPGNNTETSAHNRFLRTERSPAHGMDVTAVRRSRSPVPQFINRKNSGFGSTAWLPNDNRSIHADPPTVCSVGSGNQQPVSTYAASPLSHPVEGRWTIPSIHEVLQGTGAGSDIPFVQYPARAEN